MKEFIRKLVHEKKLSIRPLSKEDVPTVHNFNIETTSIGPFPITSRRSDNGKDKVFVKDAQKRVGKVVIEKHVSPEEHVDILLELKRQENAEYQVHGYSLTLLKHWQDVLNYKFVEKPLTPIDIILNKMPSEPPYWLYLEEEDIFLMHGADAARIMRLEHAPTTTTNMHKRSPLAAPIIMPFVDYVGIRHATILANKLKAETREGKLALFGLPMFRIVPRSLQQHIDNRFADCVIEIVSNPEKFNIPAEDLQYLYGLLFMLHDQIEVFKRSKIGTDALNIIIQHLRRQGVDSKACRKYCQKLLKENAGV